MDDKNLLYVFIGDVKSNNIIGDYPSKDSETHKINLLFDKICNAQITTTGQRNTISINQNILHYLITPNEIFYGVLSDGSNENNSFNLINNLIMEEITNNVNERGKLTFEGINLLKKVYEKHQHNVLKNVQHEINEVKLDVTKNIQNVITNIDDVRSLDVKSTKINDSALLFKEGSNNLRRSVWWQSMKFKIFITSIVVCIVIYIILK